MKVVSELAELELANIQWPNNGKEHWEALLSDFGSMAFFILDQLLPKDGEEWAIKLQVLAEALYYAMSARVPAMKENKDWTVEKIQKQLHEERQHPLLVYHNRPKSYSPKMRTGVVIQDPTFFIEDSEQDLAKKMQLGKSEIHGQGVFAKEEMAKNTVIRNCYKGIIRYVWETDGWSREADCYNMSLPVAQDLLVYCPLNADSQPGAKWPNRYVFYFNRQQLPLHAANVKFYTPRQYPWLVWLKTLRRIQPGEEMLLDTYGHCYEL